MADNITISDGTENEDDATKTASPGIPPESDQQSATTPPASEADAIDALKEKLAAAEAAAAERHDRLLRMSAEFENYKKRSAKETSDFKKYANEALLRDLLHVVDNLERALETCDASDNSEAIREGVALTLKDMLKVFDKFAVAAVSAVGSPFDPVFHQAVMQEPSATEPENTVIRELQKGYTLHGRLLRPAMVVVATPMPSTDTAASSESAD